MFSETRTKAAQSCPQLEKRALEGRAWLLSVAPAALGRREGAPRGTGSQVRKAQGHKDTSGERFCSLLTKL